MWDADKEFSREEFANCLTHGGGLLFAVVGAGILCSAVAENTDTAFRLACWLYAVALIAVYAASTLSHLFHNPAWRRFFRSLDQGVIFLFIAATLTPMAVAHLEGTLLWVLLAGSWAAALIGFYSKVFRGHRVESTAITHYLAMGWLPAIAMVPILKSLPTIGVVWFVAGGLCYTIGTVFLTLDTRVRYFHALWHLLVIAGSFCHFLVIVGCTAPFAS